MTPDDSSEHTLSLLRRKLKEKEHELSSTIGFMVKFEQEQELLINHFKQLRPYLNREGKRLLDLILHDSKQQQLNRGFDRENRFEQLNHLFYLRLDEAAPGITRTERLLCAYLHLQLSPAEIAKATGKKLNAVNVSFSRIRNRFSVKNNVELRSRLSAMMT